MAGRNQVKLNGVAIADTSIRQPVFITMLMLLTVVVGALAYSTLPVNLLPDIDIPTVAVTVPYPGANPTTMADQVAEPVEDQLATLNGLRHITSQSREGNALFIIEFNTGTNVDRGLQDVRDKVNAVLPTLPNGVEDPVFQKFDPNQQPILTMVVASKGGQNPLQLRALVDDVIVPRLQQANGVGAIDVSGGQLRQINVRMDLEKLKAYSILPAQITRSIQNANGNRGLGTITAGEQDISLRAPSIIQKPEDIARIQITGTRYRVGDVATIEDGVEEVRGYSRLNGEDAITIDIRRQSGTNIVQVADAVKEQANGVFEQYPDLAYNIPQDQSEEVQDSTSAAIEELLVAAVGAMLVVLLFFRDLRNTLTTVAGLPVIMIGTFALISLFGITINLVSLLALSVSVGLVIDDAIVVRENIFRHMERGEAAMIAASRGTAQVSLSVLAMSLTIVAVFLPVAFTSGVTGIIFKSFGITVACAMVISLIEAFTLAPMLSAYFGHRTAQMHGNEHSESAELTPEQEAMDEANAKLGPLERVYERTLSTSLRHRWLVVLGTIGVLAVSVFAATGLKFAFFPQSDTHQFAAGFEYPPGTTLAVVDESAKRMEQILRADSAVETVQSTVGGEGTTERAQFYVKLKGEEPTIPTQDRLRPQLEGFPTLAFGKPSFQGVSTEITARDIQISFQTTRDPSEIIPALQQFNQQATQYPYLTDIDTTYKPGRPELQFFLDPTRIGDLGYSQDDIASSVRALINGDTAGQFREAGKDTDIVVRLGDQDRQGVEAIQGLTVPTANGNLPLSSIANVQTTLGPTTIRRYDRLNQVIVGANVQGRNVSEVQQELDVYLKQQQAQGAIPPDVQVGFVGQAQSQNEGFNTLFIAMGLSILFVYMVLASQFGSFLQPLVIMMAMPFSFLGAFVALRLTGIELSIFGMIGLIMLLGLVVKNSILMVDFTNRLREAGLEKHHALARAGAIRLRPILMTTIALIVGSLPAAIGLGEGADTRRPLATVVIGGLITSVLLTLLVIPTAYSLLDSVTVGVGRLFRRGKRDSQVAPEPVVPVATGAPSAPVAVPVTDDEDAVIANVPVNGGAIRGGTGRSGDGDGSGSNGGASTTVTSSERRETR